MLLSGTIYVTEYRCSQETTWYVNFAYWAYLKMNLQGYVRVRHTFSFYTYASQASVTPCDDLHRFKEDDPRELCRKQY